MPPRFCIEVLEMRVLLDARVVGYLPDYRYATMFNRIDWDAVTHINYFAIRANPDGSLGSTSSSGFNWSQLDSTVAAAHARGKTVSIVIDPGSAFTTIMASPSITAAFASNIKTFAAAHNVDGIDLDWEPAWGTATVAAINNYGTLINTLNTEAPNLLITAAVNPLMVPTDSGNRYVVPLSAANTLDWINVMGYDITVPDHTNYTLSINSLNGWGNYVAGAGMPKSRVLLGVPFYARTNTWGNTRTYQEIIDTYAPAPNLDNVSGWYFNGQDTLRNKAQYVMTNGYGGVMIWEMAQDHFSGGQYTSRSLLPVIKSVVLPAYAALAGGTLTINAQAAGGAISLGTSGASITLSAPAGSLSFTAASVSSIVFSGTGNDDTLAVNNPIAAPITFNGGAGLDTLNVNSGASITITASQQIDVLNLAGGSASLAPGGSLLLTVQDINTSAAGALDLADNALIVDYASPASPLATLRTCLTSGYNFGAWNGSGIRSSAAATDPATAIGYGEASSFFSTFPVQFLGQTIDQTTIVARHTLAADADLDRDVDLDDFNRLASNFGQADRSFADGDFNFDRLVDLDDFNILASRFGTTMRLGARSDMPRYRINDEVSAITDLLE